VAAAGLDLVLVLVFAAVGRASHAEDSPVLGVLATAWPFLLGAAVGWWLVHARSRQWPTEVGPGIPVVVAAVVLGMLLRVVTGAGTAFSFVVVATVVLAVLLLGWRAAAGRWRRR
jgi:peptidoglycan/LPS O-acetylase OafA/YrhL